MLKLVKKFIDYLEKCEENTISKIVFNGLVFISMPNTMNTKLLKLSQQKKERACLYFTVKAIDCVIDYFAELKMTKSKEDIKYILQSSEDLSMDSIFESYETYNKRKSTEKSNVFNVTCQVIEDGQRCEANWTKVPLIQEKKMFFCCKPHKKVLLKEGKIETIHGIVTIKKK